MNGRQQTGPQTLVHLRAAITAEKSAPRTVVLCLNDEGLLPANLFGFTPTRNRGAEGRHDDASRTARRPRRLTPDRRSTKRPSLARQPTYHQGW